MTDPLAPIAHWLHFSKSVILCGEPWTATCDQDFANAMMALSALRAATAGPAIGPSRRLDEPKSNWRWVPVEPTGAMRFAGMSAPRSSETQNAKNTMDRHSAIARDIYAAMIAAAPQGDTSAISQITRASKSAPSGSEPSAQGEDQ